MNERREPRQRVIALVDDDPLADAVLDVAAVLAAPAAATVESVTVCHGGPSARLVELAGRAGAPLRVIDDDIARGLLRAVEDDDVLVAVIGSRSHPSGPGVAGSTALELIRRATTPVVVVPAATVTPIGPITRVLLPLDDRIETSAPVVAAITAVLGDTRRIQILHVLGDASTPAMLDRPVRDLEWFGRVFARRHVDRDVPVDVRTGTAPGNVARRCTPEDADLVAVAWQQDMSSGRAITVKSVLAASTVPVLLVPTRPSLRPSS